MVRVASGASVPSAQGNAPVHAPAFDRNTRPAGVGSVTVTPSASDGPLFVITDVNTTFGPPGTAVAGPVFTIATSADGCAVPVVVLELFPGVGSVVDDVTAAVFDTIVPTGVDEARFTTSVNTAGAAGRSVGSVQVTVPAAPTAGLRHDQPPGDANDTNVVPAGSVSVNETANAVDAPAFVAVIVYVTFCPGTTVAGPAFTTCMSAWGVSESLSVAVLFPG